jgi:hypothetical protein
MSGRVLAFPTRKLDDPPFSLCGAATGPPGDDVACHRCRAAMHSECYWGRIASLEEWKVYLQHVVETNDNFKPSVVCTECRQGEGSGKE